jgi:hypothetical protein
MQKSFIHATHDLKQAHALAYTERVKTPWVNLIALTVK